MTEQKMIDEMIDLQRKYDAAVCKEFNCTFDKEKTRLAMIDELGEFNHEVKKSWCWWKKTQKDIDKNKTLTMFDTLYAIGKKFDFSMEDVYEAYKKKNKTNWERLASNY